MDLQNNPEQGPEQPSCSGWVIRDGIIVQCAEPLVANGLRNAKIRSDKRFHSGKCSIDTKLLKERGFALDDRYVKTCGNLRCPLPERKFVPTNWLKDYCSTACRNQAAYDRDPEERREAAKNYYRENKEDVLFKHANPTPEQLNRRHAAERGYRTRHKAKIEIQTAKRFIKKHGDMALPSDLRAEVEELRALREAGMLAPSRAKNVGGRPEGMTKERQKQARELLQYIQAFIDKQGHDDGSIPYAAVKAYPSIARGTAIERAKKTLKDYRKFVGGQKPPA